MRTPLKRISYPTSFAPIRTTKSTSVVLIETSTWRDTAFLHKPVRRTTQQLSKEKQNVEEHVKGCSGKVCTSRLKHFKLHVKPIEQVIYHTHQRQSAINLQKNNVQQRQRGCAQRIVIPYYTWHKSPSPQVTISYKGQSGKMFRQAKYEFTSQVKQTARNCLPTSAQIVAY